MQLGTVRILNKNAGLLTIRIYAVVIVYFDPGIDDQNGLKPFGFKVRDQFWRIGKSFLIPRKNAITVHVIDIKIDYVGRDLVFAKAVCDLANSRFGKIGPTRLLITKRPYRWKRRLTGQFGVSGKNVFWRPIFSAGENEVIKVAAISTE